MKNRPKQKEVNKRRDHRGDKLRRQPAGVEEKFEESREFEVWDRMIRGNRGVRVE